MINIAFSTTGYMDKPNVAKVKYKEHKIELHEMIGLIKNGYVFSALFSGNDEEYGQWNRKYINFKGTQMLMIDVDDAEEPTLDELLDKQKLKPTIAYTTFSHGIKGNRYRMMYFFKDLITDINVYKQLYDCIIQENNLQLDDNCGKNPTQAVIGSKEDCELYYSEKLYDIAAFDIKTHCEMCTADSILKKEKKKEESIIPSGTIKLDNSLFQDYYTMNDHDFLNKYLPIYPYFDRTPLSFDEDKPYILLPSNYLEIQRYWLKEQQYDMYGNARYVITRPKLLRNGERRRWKLFLNGVIRRFMVEGLSLEQLLVNLFYELVYYIDNTDKEDFISKKDLLSIAKSAFKANLNNYKDKLGVKTDKRQFIINSEYCIKNNLTKRQAMNLSKRLITYNKIGELYDPTLSDKDNLSLMKECGLSIGRSTLYHFKNEFGLNKFKKGNKETFPIAKHNNDIIINVNIESMIQLSTAS